MKSGANIALVAAASQTFDNIGTPEMTGWLVIENESPFSVNLQLNGIGYLTVPAQYLWPIWTKSHTYNWDGSCTLMPAADMTISTPPSTFLRFHTFLPDEPCPVTQPVPIIRSTNVGGGTLLSNQISPDGGAHSLSAVYDSVNGRMLLEPGGSAGVHPLGVAITYIDAGGIQRIGILENSDGSGGVGGISASMLTWDALGNIVNAGNHTIGGVIASLAGQATVGPSGVPPIVRRTYEQHVVATTVATIASFVPSANGLYRVQMYGTIKGTTNGTAVSANANWVDPNGGGSNFSLPAWTQTAAAVGAIQILAAVNLGTNTASFTTMAVMLDLTAGTGVSLTFHDAAGAAISDFVSAIIEGPF